MNHDSTTPGGAVLSDPYRFHVCRYLAREDDVVVTLEELTWTVADAERSGTDATVSKFDERRIATTLHHVHLPKLDDADVVEYDHESLTVRADSGLEIVVDLLEALDDPPSYADVHA